MATHPVEFGGPLPVESMWMHACGDFPLMQKHGFSLTCLFLKGFRDPALRAFPQLEKGGCWKTPPPGPRHAIAN